MRKLIVTDIDIAMEKAIGKAKEANELHRTMRCHYTHRRGNEVQRSCMHCYRSGKRFW